MSRTRPPAWQWSRLVGSQRIRASMGLLLATVLVSAAGFAREIAIASALGLGAGLDRLATTIAFALLLSSALANASTAALTPSIVDARRTDRAAGQQIEASALAFTVASGLLIGLVGFLVSVPVAASVGFGEFGDANADEVAIGFVVGAALVAGAFRGTVGAVFNAQSRFVFPASVPITGSLIVVVAVAALGASTAWALGNWFAVGLLSEAAILLVAAVWIVRPARPSRASLAQLRPAGGRWFFSLSSALVFGASPVIDLIVANQIATGSAAALALASRIPLAVAALVAAVVATPVFTTMSEAASARGVDGVLPIADRERKRALVFGVPLAVVIAVVGYPVALIAYSNGEMTIDDARSVAITQAVYCASIAPYLAGVLLSRALMSLGGHRAVFVAALFGAIANLGLDIVLSQIWGRNGIALATGLVYALTMSIMWWLLRRLRRGASDQAAL